jgi:hypothetical protein
VVRFWNHEVLNRTDAILEEIAGLLSNPHPSLSLKGRGLKKMTPSKGL